MAILGTGVISQSTTVSISHFQPNDYRKQISRYNVILANLIFPVKFISFWSGYILSWSFSSQQTMDQASFSLDSLSPSDNTCPHCGKSEHSVSHGYVYKQTASNHREVVGKRILCSRHDDRNGCGRTRQWCLVDVVPRRHYQLFVFILFIRNLLSGDAVGSAGLQGQVSY